MDVILVPGLWLDADSWRGIEPSLNKAGHTTHALTMPGTGASAAESSEIGIADWVAATVAEIDRVGAPVALVGHSGGGNVVWGAADARVDAVARVIFVDSAPPPNGVGISEFELVDGVVPFPGWETFDEPDVADLDDETRAAEAARTQSVPAKVPTDPIALSDPRRYEIPVTVLSGNADEAEFRRAVAEWGPWAEEFAGIRSAEVVRLDSGHWPQFSVPDRLSAALVAALGER